MTSSEPLVRFYDLSGPKPWSPACWCTRYALNYKGIPYETVKISYPAIEPKCKELFADMTGLEATVPIIEVLGPQYKPLNDSAPIAMLLNERFTEEMGYRHLNGVEELAGYECRPERAIIRWVLNDVYENALDPDDGSKEYFKRTREEQAGCAMKDFMQVKGGGEEGVWAMLKDGWAPLRERMKGDDGAGECKCCQSVFLCDNC